METTLGEFDKEIMHSEKVQSVMYGGHMVGDSRACTYDDIIHVDADDRATQSMLVNEGVENVVHHRLERGGWIGESKVHDHGFPNTKAGFESHLPLITIIDVNVIVPPSDIKGVKDEQVG